MEHLSPFTGFIKETTGYHFGFTQLKDRRLKYVVIVEKVGTDNLQYLKEPTMFISLRKDGSIMKVFNERTLSMFNTEYFRPMDNGNPSFIVCNPTGHPVFSLMIDEQKGVLLVCDKDPHITK